MNNSIILAVDGHDGTGKTTLAKELAKKIGAKYVRPYKEPFGSLLLDAYDNGNFELILKTGEEAIEIILDESLSDAILVFDRLWITLFTLLPPSFCDQWTFRPPTAICWADLPTTLSRIGQRDEKKYSKEWHAKYIEMYEKFSHIYRCELIPTHELNEGQSLERLVIWAKKFL